MSACDRYRGWIHSRIDGDLDADAARELRAHLGSCASCRDEATSLEMVAVGLRDLRPETMPDAAFEAVLAHTSGSSRGRVVPFVRRRAAWIGLAAAAAVVVAAILVPSWRGGPVGPTPEETARARQEAQMALAIAAKALRRAETAGDRVLTDEVSPALKRIPIRWRHVAETDRRQRT